MFSQRVLVALDTSQGVVYAAASGWNRVYLHWMFRNFRSLPQNVLSPRQQQLIGYLYRETSNGQPRELYDAVVVGMVEGFRPSSLAKPIAAAQGVKSAIGRALGHKPFHAPIAFNRMTLKVGTAALAVAIAILAWHQLGAQPVAGSTSTQTVTAAHSADEPVAIAKDAMAKDQTSKDLGPALLDPASNSVAALPSATPLASADEKPVSTTAHVGTAAPAVQRSETPPIASVPQLFTLPPSRTLAATGRREPNESTASTHHPVTASSKVYEALADQPRMQISGRPRKLVYPVCPETQARGKVSLQAVVNYDGAVSRVRVLTGDRALAAAAVEAVRQWRYEPFSGTAPRLERETNITISFISNEVVAVSFPGSAPLSR